MNTCPHCNTAIEEHVATRCLDAWVAERVVGWKDLPLGSEAILHYSTDAHAALEVIYVMNRESLLYRAAWSPSGQVKCDIVHTLQDYYKDWRERHVCTAYGDTAPLAICRAALMAKGNTCGGTTDQK